MRARLHADPDKIANAPHPPDGEGVAALYTTITGNVSGEELPRFTDRFAALEKRTISRRSPECCNDRS
ncbi:MAG TPA: hypothetical protein VIF88_02090 [Methylocystis sp.]|jgi:hypothetical protein